MTSLTSIPLWAGAIVIGGLGFLHWRTRLLAWTAEQALPPCGEFATVPGGEIHYLDLGPKDAPAIVLIHGLSGQLQNFNYGVAEQLAQDHRVIVPDRPGCGYSRRDGAARAAIPEQGRMISALLDHLGIEKPTIVGHSLGGAVALAMALDRGPEATAALALICPLTHDQSDVPEVFKGLEIRTEWLRKAISQTIAVPVAKATATKTLNAVFHPEPAEGDFLHRGGAILGLRPSAFVTASEDLQGVERSMPAQAARYGDELKISGGVLYGAQDAILSPQIHGESMQQFGLSYEALEGRGHMIPMTAPDECVEFIRRMEALGTP